MNMECILVHVLVEHLIEHTKQKIKACVVLWVILSNSWCATKEHNNLTMLGKTVGMQFMVGNRSLPACWLIEPYLPC
ncbi:hypothetical protein Hanom_Chr17g01524741 [Helianthus anomalus]